VSSLLEFLSKYINKTLILIIICLFFGASAFCYLNNILVTEDAFAKEIENIQEQIQSNQMQARLQIFMLQKSMLEKQIWDLDARVDDSTDEISKSKWMRRLERTEDELKDINTQIDKLKK
jgi:predicted PurR-regulated permease PerM